MATIREEVQRKMCSDVKQLFNKGEILNRVFKFIRFLCDINTSCDLYRFKHILLQKEKYLKLLGGEQYTDPLYLSFNEFVNFFKWILDSDEFRIMKETGFSPKEAWGSDVVYKQEYEDTIKEVIVVLESLMEKHQYRKLVGAY